jgi:nicotinate-nucleotide adenylyltransferase
LGPESRSVAILGGTFDPIHFAHLRLAEEIADRLQLREVRFIPAAVPPHRATPEVTAAHRLEMVRLAVSGNPRFTVDDRECRRAGPSYTVDTLRELRAELGAGTPLLLLMGVDAYVALMTWSRWEQLYDLAHIVIAQRPGYALDARALPPELARRTQAAVITDPARLEHSPAGHVLVLDTSPLDISATAIRRLLADGHSTRYLLPEEVLDYIHQQQLYKDFDANRGD